MNDEPTAVPGETEPETKTVELQLTLGGIGEKGAEVVMDTERANGLIGQGFAIEIVDAEPEPQDVQLPETTDKDETPDNGVILAAEPGTGAAPLDQVAPGAAESIAQVQAQSEIDAAGDEPDQAETDAIVNDPDALAAVAEADAEPKPEVKSGK